MRNPTVEDPVIVKFMVKNTEYQNNAEKSWLSWEFRISVHLTTQEIIEITANSVVGLFLFLFNFPVNCSVEMKFLNIRCLYDVPNFNTLA